MVFAQYVRMRRSVGPWTKRAPALEAILLAVFAIPLAAVLAALVYRSTLKFPINPWNEGWNAYHVTALLTGGPLYFPPDALITNNYPPLSFYIIAPFTILLGDAIFAGRLVSWLSFATIAVSIASISYQLNADRIAALSGSAIFAALMVINYSSYVGMNDPQLLGHAIVLIGLWIYVRHSGAAWSGVAAGILMACGLFVKHNIFALPLTLVVWLAIHDRRAAIRFAAAGLLTGGISFVCCLLIFGPVFVTGLLAPRQYFPDRILSYPLHRLLPMQIPLLLAALGAVVGCGNRFTGLYLGYIVTSITVAGVLVGGEGVSINVMFEVVIALSLAAGHVIARLPRGGDMRIWVLCGYAFACFYNAALLATKDQIMVGRWIVAQRANEIATAEVIRMLSDQPGPVLCEALTICYWTARPFEFDPFNFQQGVIAGIKDENIVLRRITSGYYAAIELPGDGLQPPDMDLLGPRIRGAIIEHYRKIPTVPGGMSVFVREAVPMSGGVSTR